MNLIGKFMSWLYSYERPPVSPPEHPCVHGTELVDCEELCAGCRHPCRGHGSGLCGAMWAEELDNPIDGMGPVYVQRWCKCDRFKP